MGGVCCRCQHATLDDHLLLPRASASAMSVNFSQFYVPAPLAATSASSSSSSSSIASLTSPTAHISQSLASYVSFPFPFVKKPKLLPKPDKRNKSKTKVDKRQKQQSEQLRHGQVAPYVGEHWRKTPTGAFAPLSLLELSVRSICAQLLVQQQDALSTPLPTELAAKVLTWLRQHYVLEKPQFQTLAPFLMHEWNLADQQEVDDSWFDDIPLETWQYLKSIDVSGCHQLQQFGSEGGQFIVEMPELIVASFQDCTALTKEAIQGLQLSTKLTALNLSGCNNLDDDCLDALNSLTRLKSLDLVRVFILFCRLLVSVLTLVRYGQAGCRNLTDQGIKHMTQMSKLEKLRLARCMRLTDEAFDGLALQFSELRELDVASCRISERALQEIGYLTNLEVLVIRGCQDINDDGMSFLTCLTNLKYFDARHCAKIHSIPTEWTQLQVLLLGYTAFAEADAAVLQHLTNLRELDLRKCRVMKRGFQFVSHLHQLERLGLAETPLMDAELLEICNGAKKLKALNISNTEIGDKGTAGLAKLKELRILRLDTPGITNRALANLSFLAQLERLDLFGANITDNGLMHLIPLHRLQELAICGGSIGDRGVGLISKLTSLTSLNLSQNRNIRTKSLFYLRSLTGLRCLNLSNTGISALSLRHLSPLKELQSLSVYGCSLSQGHIDVLRVSAVYMIAPPNVNGNISEGIYKTLHDVL
ncbi:hypothetical protein PHYBOEH_005189 [Phytophthora boehmeriae]|uniref:Uncharacterized protein n=1 Tax=Phytophthora boehmeriae TaxID=109152 RepID=A0A8T1WRQ5_9STRA|nr:hypothetical protein PHYBOEH_005189 [Phytophthora boehmeriae]